MEKKDLDNLVILAKTNNLNFEKLLEECKEIIIFYSSYFFIDNYNEEDLKQVILLTIWNSLDSFDSDKSNFKTYIKIRIFNSLSFILRKAKQKKRNNNNISLDKKDDEDNSLLEKISNNDHLHHYDDIEEFNYLQSELVKVLSGLEKIVYFHHIRGEGRTSISRMMKCSYKSVDNTLERIKDKAKRVYNEYIERM